MSKYSEMMGSFLRTGNYPIEADYIFSSEDELVQYYNIPENKAILHKGLLKVVATEELQSLYWVVNQEGELKFVKLINQLDIQNLESLIQDILNSLTIDSILGSPLPSEQFRTLRGIEDVVTALTQLTKNRTDNLQSEIDLILIGVGLSGDGSYNADQETYYLKNATSVMNALKTLDSLVNKALTEKDSNSLKMAFVTQSEYDAISDKDLFTNYAILRNNKIVKMYTGKYEWDLCRLFAEDNVPKELMYYGYIVDSTITSFDQITYDMVKSSNTIDSKEVSTLGKTSIGIVPKYAWIFIAIPTTVNYIATKDNGIGGLVAFDESIVGTNGDVTLTFDNIQYKIYGEYSTIEGERFIYIN